MDNENELQEPPYRQIRASYTDSTIRVYQAFSDEIADAALAAGGFRLPFKMTRMTWIKPSFLWMMYRAGWGYKDEGQRRILAVDVLRSGFDWVLRHAVLSTHGAIESVEPHDRKRRPSVIVQWDPERDLKLSPLPYRSIQIGLSQEAVQLYVHDWIQRISEVTSIAHEIHQCLEAGQIDKARSMLPVEQVYLPQVEGLRHIGLE